MAQIGTFSPKSAEPALGEEVRDQADRRCSARTASDNRQALRRRPAGAGPREGAVLESGQPRRGRMQVPIGPAAADTRGPYHRATVHPRPSSPHPGQRPGAPGREGAGTVAVRRHGGGKPGPHTTGGARPDPDGVPARPRPDHPLQGVPPAQAQDAGVHRPDRRPLRHPVDAHAGSRPDRPHDRPGAQPERGPDRGDRARPRHGTHAVRPRRRRGDGRDLPGRLPTRRAEPQDRRQAGEGRRGPKPDVGGPPGYREPLQAAGTFSTRPSRRT